MLELKPWLSLELLNIKIAATDGCPPILFPDGLPVSTEFTDAELEAYLDEALDPGRAAEVEQQVRSDTELLHRLSHINGRRDAGIHTLGEIWRRNQIGVPSLEQMGNYLLGVLEPEMEDYIKFRLETLRCPFTMSMHRDLKQQQESGEENSKIRREKYFNSSAGLLKKKEEE